MADAGHDKKKKNNLLFAILAKSFSTIIVKNTIILSNVQNFQRQNTSINPGNFCLDN